MASPSPQVTIRSLSDDYCEFVLAGVDVAFANALRRIMISEVKRREFWLFLEREDKKTKG